ncbi:hypothetical protein [Nocardioides plantarum]|uniref:Uncharacterized protein n=1 Tax=Nocardioides plantarum TaxID=29299 RepID=A0ABV5KEL3_9ACTN|nr:hypothetical protein [Nocardioides plantarum]
MTDEWSVPGWVVLAALAVLAVLVVVLVLALVRTRSRHTAALEGARADAAALALQVEAIEQRLAEPAPAVRADETEYVVTMLGRETGPGESDEPAPVVPAPLFADLVLREGVVQAASLAAGLRRALAPEARHRIRFEMKREVKRARKQRRADLRQAKREYDARQRGAVENAA